MKLPDTQVNLAKRAGNDRRKKSRFASSKLPAYLCVQIESGQKLWFEFDHKADTIKQIAQDEDNEFVPDKPYFSITTEDHRIETPKTLKNQKAQSELARAQDSMDGVVIINESSRLGAVYGTTKSRIAGENIEGMPSPFVFLVDKYLKTHGKTDRPLLISVVIEQGGLAIFFAYTSTGNVLHQVALSMPDAYQGATSFSSRIGLDANAELLSLTKEDLFKGVSQVPVYPKGGGLANLNLNKILPVASRLAALGALGLGGYAFYLDHQIASLNEQIITQQQMLSQATQSISKHFYENPVGISSALSVDWVKAFAEVEALWVEESIAESNIDQQAVSHVISLNIKPGKPRTLSGLIKKELIAETLEKTLPAGCQRTAVEFGGNLNEIKSKYSCMGRVDSINRFGF